MTNYLQKPNQNQEMIAGISVRSDILYATFTNEKFVLLLPFKKYVNINLFIQQLQSFMYRYSHALIVLLQILIFFYRNNIVINT